MGESKVYFTSFKTTGHENLIAETASSYEDRLDLKTIDFNEKYAAIKIHFGEYGNLAFLTSKLCQRWLQTMSRSSAERPFLTDCNTLYVGSRKNALDHLETAYVNGLFALTRRGAT